MADSGRQLHTQEVCTVNDTFQRKVYMSLFTQEVYKVNDTFQLKCYQI